MLVGGCGGNYRAECVLRIIKIKSSLTASAGDAFWLQTRKSNGCECVTLLPVFLEPLPAKVKGKRFCVITEPTSATAYGKLASLNVKPKASVADDVWLLLQCGTGL